MQMRTNFSNIPIIIDIGKDDALIIARFVSFTRARKMEIWLFSIQK